MSFINDIRTAAENAARDGLGKLGISVSQKARIPDDEDTYSPDIIDLYNKKTSSHDSEPTALIVPEDMRDVLRNEARTLSFQNDLCMQTVESWFLDRRSTIAEPCDSLSSVEEARSELMKILKDQGFVCMIGDTPDTWLHAICEIGHQQGRVCYNLFIQASKQVNAENFEDWCREMNEKLSRFSFEIVPLEGGMIGLR
ncbi:MAG: hypothetical protein J6A01_03230 [Proteobacteria bacterium]|nr:hypothetical protein [Pseudomonadota bacterium]